MTLPYRKIREFIQYVLSPELDWIQLEVTTRCNSSCIYCPHTVFAESWENHDLDMQTFNGLIPAFKNAKLVFLQGWGEPFLHPEILDMLKIVKSAGCKAGTTTNGTLLDDHVAKNLVSLEVDIVAFSLAGTDESDDYLRNGSPLSSVLSAVSNINKYKQKMRKDKPEIHIAYMALRSNFDKLISIPKLIEGHGISEVVVSVLDFVPSESLLGESITPSSEELMKNRNRLRQLEDQIATMGSRIYYRFPSECKNNNGCPENICRSLFVSADGNVSPCVYLRLPVSGTVSDMQRSDGQCRQLSFGNLKLNSLSAIWNSRQYRRFRAKMEDGRPDDLCTDCRRLYTE